MDNGDALPKRVLIVEDDLDICETLACVLRTLGHKVDFAVNGNAAIQVAQEFLPEVVVLDLGLPGMDGFQVATRLRQMACLRGLRIIMVGGRGLPGDCARSMWAGCDHYLVKPVDPALLERAL